MFKNKTEVMGFLGRDAEVKNGTNSNVPFTILSLATTESWKNKETGEYNQRTEWHKILVFGKLGEFAATLQKGAHLDIEGQLRSRTREIEVKVGRKNETKTIRDWFIRAAEIRKLDRAARADASETEAADSAVDEVPF